MTEYIQKNEKLIKDMMQQKDSHYKVILLLTFFIIIDK